MYDSGFGVYGLGFRDQLGCKVLGVRFGVCSAFVSKLSMI